MRTIAVWVACLALAGCNLVTTTAPLIVDDGPRLRDGVWTVDDARCAFDPKAPIDAWPECASPFVVKGDQARESKAARPPDSASYAVSPGRPWLIQVRVGSGTDQGFFYMAADPVRQASNAQVIALTGWVAVCGPTPPKGRMVSAHPFPGLTVARGRTPSSCTTSDLETVRNAGRLSKTVSDVTALRWVREGDH